MCFWDVGGYSLRFIYRLSTSALFDGEFGAPSGERTDEEDWPPFKKVSSRSPVTSHMDIASGSRSPGTLKFGA